MNQPQLTDNIDASVKHLETLQLINSDSQRVHFVNGYARLTRKKLLGIMAEMHKRGQEDMRRVAEQIIKGST